MRVQAGYETGIAYYMLSLEHFYKLTKHNLEITFPT